MNIQLISSISMLLTDRSTEFAHCYARTFGFGSYKTEIDGSSLLSMQNQ
jgi:hypothetical protein